MEGVIELAVAVRKVHFSYEFGKSKVETLKGVNLTASTGTIYAILGPSGCGKTTLLKCIVGNLNAQMGLISVFGQRPGQRPGQKKSITPRPGIGYMPQEYSLYEDLTIEENLNFYGRLHNMENSNLQLRIKYLLDFLHLPFGVRLAGTLSGGEKRRVSFAISVLCVPSLIILDEPTVGMDPLLRESIWNHLKEISVNEKVTVIFTTHHVDEAAQANNIGLMRNGKTLTEGKPEELLSRFNLPNLDNLYLNLCREDSRKEKGEVEQNGECQTIRLTTASNTSQPKCSIGYLPQDRRLDCKEFFPPQSFRRITTLTRKNFIKMKRNTILFFFQFLFPAIQISAFTAILNGDFYNVPVAVCNEDTFLGSRFLLEINNKAIHQLHVNSMNDGVNLILTGQALAAIHIWNNFSESLIERFATREKDLSTDLIQASHIHMRYDTTNIVMTQFLQGTFHESLLAFARKQLGNLKKHPRLVSTLIEDGQPIYGPYKSNLNDFMSSAAIIGLTFLLAASTSSVLFITDKTGGLLDRNYISGVTSFEIMCGHVLTQLGVIVIQIGISLVISVEVFGITNHGSVLLIIILSVISGMAGMSFGFLISTICNNASSAIMLSVSILLPNYFISGIAVTIACANDFVQTISPVLPLNLAFYSVRWIMLRGRDILWTPVWLGFLVMFTWLALFLTLSVIVIYLKRRF